MIKILTLMAFLSTVSLISSAQDTTQLKRVPYKLTVAVNKSFTYEEDIKATSYVLPDKTIQLYPGETVYIEVEQDNGIIKKMTAVKEITNPSKTLTITFSQTAKKKVHESMMLKIKNPLPYKLVYKATMFLLSQKRWVDTDVFPVEPGIFGIETWRDIIITIGLGYWTLQPK